MKTNQTFHCAAIAAMITVACNASIDTKNFEKLLVRGEYALAGNVLADEIHAEMSREDVTATINCLERFADKLPGGDPSLAVRKFTPPDEDESYKKVVSEGVQIGDITIPASFVKLGSKATPFMAWKNDAQRLIVASEYLDKSKLMSAGEANKELSGFEALKKIVKLLNGVVASRCQISGPEQDHYLAVRKGLSTFKEDLKIRRTRFLSYEVVSPYLYEAHACLFVGISASVRISSLNKAQSELVNDHKKKGVKLLGKSCHKEWLYSCSEDVRDQFVDVQKFIKEYLNESEFKEIKVVLTISDCNDPSKPRGANYWME